MHEKHNEGTRLNALQAMIHDLFDLFRRRGTKRYELGSADSVSQLEHALQCAALAQASGAPDALVAAALLHDTGHLLPEREAEHGHDDVHQYLALPFLRPCFPLAVLEPIRLHVDAKRWLCAKEPGYWDTLSQGSKLSLELQGGPFDASQAAAFVGQPHAREAILLRRWDDGAKCAGLVVPALDAYRDLLMRVGH